MADKPHRTVQEYAAERRAAKHERNKVIEIEKAKKPAYGHNSPVIGDNGMQTAPGDNRKYLLHTMQVAALPLVSLMDADAVAGRVSEYFTLCTENDMKPIVSGLAMALGIDRRGLYNIRNDYKTAHRCTSEVVVIIKKAYAFMENMWENYMQNGKINPTAGVFLGANNYGYQDVRQINIAPVAPDPLGEIGDKAALAQRYALDTSPDLALEAGEPVTGD